MDLTILKNVGLTPGEIKIYEALLEHGEMPANSIIAESKLKKGDCYNKIYDLVRIGFVEEFTKAKKKHFRLAHPQKIEEHIRAKLSAISDTEREISAFMPTIVSTYNLTYHKPGVQFFEGEEGLKKLIFDSLTATTEIYSYVDVEALQKIVPSISVEYTKKRTRAGIFKKNIVTKVDAGLEFLRSNPIPFTEERYIDHEVSPFKTIMMMYDNKVSFQTVTKTGLIGFLIEDETIAKMQKNIFEIIWQGAKEIGQAANASNSSS